jgi:hypothetical protein
VVRAYKFLDEEGRAPFTGAAWPVGQWVQASGAVPCHVGIHACLAGDVAHWFAASMWHIELEGDIVETMHKVVGRRGRLIGPVDGYDAAMREMCELSAWRCRDRAVAVFREADERTLADELATTTTLEDLAAFGARCDDSTHAGRAAALAADAAHFAMHGVHAQAPFVAACSAGHVAAGPTDDQAAFDAGYRAERAFQSDFVVGRLALT